MCNDKTIKRFVTHYTFNITQMVGVILLVAGCATAPMTRPPALPSLPPQAIPKLPGSYYRTERGDTLWGIAHAFGLQVETLAHANRLQSAHLIEIGQQLFIPLPEETNRFLWPARGRYHPSHGGVDIQALQGSLVRASRGGRVAVATRRLSGWGATVVLDHGDGHLTVYAKLDQILTLPGQSIQQGVPIGRAGKGEVHFEIREGAFARDALTLLPR